MKAMEGITFGPPLIVDGKKMITEGDGGWGVAHVLLSVKRKMVQYYSS